MTTIDTRYQNTIKSKISHILERNISRGAYENIETKMQKLEETI